MGKADLMLERVKQLSENLIGSQTREKLSAWWRGGDGRIEPTANGPQSESAESHLEGSADIPNQRIRVIEALWGEGNVAPADAQFLSSLSQLGLTKEMSIGFIGIGLGGTARALTNETDVWISGYEADAAVAVVAIEQCTFAGKSKKVTITGGNYDDLQIPAKKFNSIVSKEALYLARDKARLIKQIADGIKTGGSFLYTDYVAPKSGLNDEQLARLFPADAKLAEPVAPDAHVEWMKAAGFDVRVHEDMTALFGDFVMEGWANLRRMLDQIAADKPTPAERAAFLRSVGDEAALWGNRLEAFRDGHLAVYRFVALKPA